MQSNFNIKMDLHSFDDMLQIEEFLDWLNEVERFSEYMQIEEHKQEKLVAYHLKSCLSAWWERVQAAWCDKGKEPIDTWARMKTKLWERFLLVYYEWQLYTQFQYPQGTRMANAYTTFTACSFARTWRSLIPNRSQDRLEAWSPICEINWSWNRHLPCLRQPRLHWRLSDRGIKPCHYTPTPTKVCGTC